MSEAKCCRKCGEVKPLSDFPLCRGKPRARCNPCHVSDVNEWQKKNRDKTKANQVRFRDRQRAATGREKFKPMLPEVALERVKQHKRKWREAHPDRLEAARKRWIENNKPKVMERTRRYQARKLSAVPGWADKEQMADLYKIARDLTAATGISVEVDHIVPLQSHLVCGLHCEDNLRVLRASVNRAKRNHHWPDMP